MLNGVKWKGFYVFNFGGQRAKCNLLWPKVKKVNRPPGWPGPYSLLAFFL